MISQTSKEKSRNNDSYDLREGEKKKKKVKINKKQKVGGQQPKIQNEQKFPKREIAKKSSRGFQRTRMVEERWRNRLPRNHVLTIYKKMFGGASDAKTPNRIIHRSSQNKKKSNSPAKWVQKQLTMPQVVSTPPNYQRELADCIIRSAPLDEIRILLACGAKVNDPVTQGLRPLHYAIYQRYIEAIHLLLVRGSDVDALDEVGYSALHLCAEHGHIDILEILLRHKARVDWTDHDSLDPYPNTVFADQPLRLAIKNGHYDVAKMLLQNGANPNAHYFQGSEINFVHPLNIEFLNLLLTFGADPNARDRGGVTPLMKACRHPDGMEPALLLISYGADVNAMTSERNDCRTVLHYAVLSENLQLVNLLLKQGARVNFTSDYRKPSPLDFAILRGNPDMVRILVGTGADVNASSPLIGSPLHIVCTENIENRLEILRTLLDSGANPNIYTTSEAGPLLKPPLGEYANLNSKPEVKVVEMLLGYGASVILKSQYHDPRGILKAMPRLANFPHVFEVILEAAESFHLPAIKRAKNFNPEQKQMLLKAAETPLLLKHQSRLFLRRQLQRKVNRDFTLPQRIQQLPLPQLIKMYLLYEI